MTRRLAALLLACSLAAAGAAPAPMFKPAKQVWIAGWNKPANHPRGCRFVRDGAKLTVTLPAVRDRDFNGHKTWLEAPGLFRWVEGDFAVQVRVAGDFTLPGVGWRFRGAGLLLTDGTTGCQLTRLVAVGHGAFDGCCGSAGTARRCDDFFLDESPSGRAAYLRLERLGDRLTLKASGEGRKWTTIKGGLRLKLLPKVRVGVVADANTEGTFKVVFDEFKLTPLK